MIFYFKCSRITTSNRRITTKNKINITKFSELKYVIYL